jgi:membrane associated rhomboid family serine protease
VQRLPWVTFVLMGICVLAYLYTGFLAPNDDEKLGQKLDEFFEYYSARAYLEMPPEMGQFLSEDDRETIGVMKESVDPTLLDPDDVKEEQQTLNRMALEILDTLNSNPLRKWGYVPNDPKFITIFTCIFFHEGFWHLFGNMLFLFLAGCAIEDLWGRPLFLGFYLLSGVAATLTHDLKFPSSAIPIIGASGAIAGLMGAFLVRLARTKIRLFYFIWVFRIWTGTFEAPAFIMLPLWFLQQIFYAMISNESAGVAFWAHIGGFAFGAVFAFGMDMLKIEQKYIAPSIEKKVSLVQNPLFLQAVDMAEKGEHAEALVALQKVVRQEPNHMDAYLEMRHIYEVAGDAKGFTAASAGILDAALRSRDPEMVQGNLDHYTHSQLRLPLPPKTLLGVAAFHEENNDEHNAIVMYEDLLEAYPDDPLAMKACSKMARVCFEKLNDRERGEKAFWRAYQHPLANEEWRKALQLDIKRYQIDPNAAPDPDSFAAPVLNPAPQQPAWQQPIQDHSGFEPEEAVVASVAPPVMPAPASGDSHLPSSDFDGAHSEWTVVACQIDKIGLKTISLQNVKQNSGLLPWKKIRFVSAGRIKSLAGGRPGARDSLVFDLIVQGAGRNVVLYRTTGKTLDFKKIFPGVEQTFFDAYENFIGIVLANSGARCIPDRERITGPLFAEFQDLLSYENRVREEIVKQG